LLRPAIAEAQEQQAAQEPGGDASAPACEDSAPSEDMVCLKNGTVLRGSLVDVTPDVGVVLSVAGGSTVHVEWKDVLRIRYSLTSPLRGPPAVPTVLVHLEAPQAAVLEADANGNGDWREVCAAPCDVPAQTDRRYRIAGEGLRRSNVFTLRSDAVGRERIRVRGASKGWFAVGFVIVGAGYVVAALGAALLGADGMAYVGGGGNPQTANVALYLLGAGAGIGALGLIPVIIHSRTRVSQIVDPAGASPVPAARREQERVWWRAAATDRAHAVPVFALPLVSATF
jgi:hypothetical protein